MKEEKKWLKVIGLSLGVVAIILCYQWYDWKLALIIAIMIWGNNLTNYKK